MSVTFLVRNICPGEMQGHPTSRVSPQSPPGTNVSPSDAPSPLGTPTYLFDEVPPGVGGNGVDHLQGLGERGGAVGEGRALLGCGLISQGGGRLAARERGEAGAGYF